MAESPPPSFAALLRTLRMEAGLTQEKLGEAAQVSYRSISDLERGVNRAPRRDTARLLADALGLTGEARAAFESAARGDESATADVAALPHHGMAAATRTLPRDTVSFTGRQAEIDYLFRAVTDADRAGGIVDICAIGGMAGVGKTALAVHMAHRLADRFPDGQLFLQLHGHTPGQQPVDPADALASLLNAAGVPASRIPDGLEPRAWLWRDHLVGKRLLLVLDDAEGHEQVRPLLPGCPGTFVLITSRKHLTALEDAQVVSLDTLPPEDAASLLLRLAARPGLPGQDEVVQEIVRLCGYLPLAIGMLARQLHHHPSWTAAELAADLATARDRLELMRAENLSVAAALELSYRELPPDAQYLLRYLGLHPGTDFDDYTAAAIADSDLTAIRRQISDLYDHYLLSEQSHGRYRMHDLIAEFARTLASGEPAARREAAMSRLLGYYMHTTRAAGRQFARRTPAGPPVVTSNPPAHSPGFTTLRDATAWLDAEQVNLRAATLHAASHDRPGYAIEMPSALHGYLRQHGTCPQALALHQVALDMARQLGSRPAEANALTDIADIHYLAGEFPAAASNLARALELHEENGNELGVANALAVLGNVRHLSGDNRAGEAALLDALERFRTLDDRRGQAGTLAYLSGVHLEAGDYSRAQSDLIQARRIQHGLGGIQDMVLLSQLGALQGAIGDYTAATRNLTEAIESLRSAANHEEKAAPSRHQAIAQRHLALILEISGDFEAAIANLEHALRLTREVGTRGIEASVLRNVGRLYFRTGNHAKAYTSLNQSLELYRTLGLRLGEAEVLNDLGRVSLAAGDRDEARERHERALKIATELGSLPEEAHALEGIGRCLHDQRQPIAAEAHLRRALALYERVGSPKVQEIRDTLRDLGHPAG